MLSFFSLNMNEERPGSLSLVESPQRGTLFFSHSILESLYASAVGIILEAQTANAFVGGRTVPKANRH